MGPILFTFSAPFSILYPVFKKKQKEKVILSFAFLSSLLVSNTLAFSHLFHVLEG